jgi:signal transduction histidine kinase
LVAVLVVIAALVWAAILGVVFARVIADDVRSFVALAERGEPTQAPELGAAYQQVATTLDERNRQVAMLAREGRAVPIDEEPRHVVAALVTAARAVMRDPTWRAAVLTSHEAELLPAGVYQGAEDATPVEPIGDLEQWASVSLSEQPAARLEGPWGAFAVADVSVSDRLSAILYAPWAGRPEPSPAEIAVLTVVAQHFGTALEHSLLYARVRSQADELTRLAAVQADFLRGVTHDLQTPLTSIGALATELRADSGLPPSARDDLDTITHQADRLRRMVSQLLVASRLEAGVLVAQSDVFALPPVIERTWKALRVDRPFELSIDGSPHLAVGDADRFEQVLWALLDNAVKYSPAGSPVAVDVASGAGEVSVTVRDQGVGMSTDTASSAFEQFYRSPQARKLAPDGSGVGLYAARGLMEAMGGSIGVVSALGVGSEVTIRLPAEPSEAAD